MKNKRIAIGVIFTILMIVIISTGCQNNLSNKKADHKITEKTDKTDEETYEEEFRGLTRTQWSQIIGKHHNLNPENIACNYSESGFIGSGITGILAAAGSASLVRKRA